MFPNNVGGFVGPLLPPPQTATSYMTKRSRRLYPEIGCKKFSLAFWIKSLEFFKMDEMLETVSFIITCLKTKLDCSESLTHIMGSLKIEKKKTIHYQKLSHCLH